jgi:hypothetical protein
MTPGSDHGFVQSCFILGLPGGFEAGMTNSGSKIPEVGGKGLLLEFEIRDLESIPSGRTGE